MDSCRTKLILETENPDNLGPILEKWDEIISLHSLLKVFVPVEEVFERLPSGEHHKYLRSMWGCFTAELSEDDSPFFDITLDKVQQAKTCRLEADFYQRGWVPYVGYRRMSYLIPDVTFTLYDPDLSQEGWLMSFCNGNVVKGRVDYSIFALPRYSPRDSETVLSSVPPWYSLDGLQDLDDEQQ